MGNFSDNNPITNKDRALWAEAALLNYAVDKEGGDELYDDVKTVLTDLLADLRHLCDSHDLCFGDLDKMAYQHYVAERNGDT